MRSNQGRVETSAGTSGLVVDVVRVQSSSEVWV
jgi:hypothetical protein